MSRRLHPSHYRAPSATDNPYQPTTIPLQHQCPHTRHPSKPHLPRNGYHVTTVDLDTGLSSETCTDTHSYYEYNQAYHSEKDRYAPTTDRSYSDESGSTRLPSCHHDADDESCRRFSRAAYASERRRANPGVHKEGRRVYPQPELAVYQEIPPQAIDVAPKRLPQSRLSDRPQSSMSSGVTSVIGDGCGGKCQTFENICYFILQLIFMMGILIGVSLCIAGLVLRKSAARNLQVLVYIGALLAVVSAALLGIQWNARDAAKRRKLAVRNAKRAPIPLENLNRGQQQPLMMVQEGQRVVPQILRPQQPIQMDQQGIPWWRRKDIT